ncbi:MAG TPA: hypothetical protein DCS19_05765, partial [Flavobacterium sp.]|nr:hypothetical protein [Flavobacterium sp.]
MAWNLNITNLPENEYPLLTAYKGSFDNMAQLNMTYPKSKVNSFAFIEDMNTFVVWSVALQDWQYIQHDGGLPLFTANFLINFNTVAYHGMFSIVGNSPGLFQSTNTGEGIMYQMVMRKNKVYTRTIDLTANPIVYPEFVSDTDKIAEIIHENLNGTNY